MGCCSLLDNASDVRSSTLQDEGDEQEKEEWTSSPSSLLSPTPYYIGVESWPYELSRYLDKTRMV